MDFPRHKLRPHNFCLTRQIAFSKKGSLAREANISLSQKQAFTAYPYVKHPAISQNFTSFNIATQKFFAKFVAIFLSPSRFTYIILLVSRPTG